MLPPVARSGAITLYRHLPIRQAVHRHATLYPQPFAPDAGTRSSPLSCAPALPLAHRAARSRPLGKSETRGGHAGPDIRDPETQGDRGRKARLGTGHRDGGPRAGGLSGKALLGRLDQVRRRAQCQRVLRGRGHARHAARHQRVLHRAGGAHGPWPEGGDQPEIRLRPQELLLPRPAAGLSDFAALPPAGRRGRDHRRHGAGHRPQGADRAHPRRAGRGQVDPRHGPETCPSWTSTAPASP